MKVSIELDVKERLDLLVSWIGKRAEDKAHNNNRDLIADFLDKFIVVELKRLENKPETILQDVEVPDSVLSAPLKAMKKKMDKAFNDFLAGKTGGTLPEEEEEESQTGTQTAVTATEATPPGNSTGPRNGNGHTVGFKRKLNDDEKDFIRSEFMKLNGQFEDAKKSCTAMLPQMGDEITVWQVTGFVSYLHREIAAGRLQVGDMPAYMEFLEAHKKLWAQYNSSKYQKLRKQNATPSFKSGGFKQKTA